MIDQEFIAKLKELIDDYVENCEDKEECVEEKPDVMEEKPEDIKKKEGELIIIQGNKEGEEMPEDLRDLIDFIRRG